MAKLVLEVKLSEHWAPFVAAALDLLQAVEQSDAALVTDEISVKACALRHVVNESIGEL
jgi:hypothetical protein